MLQRPINVKGDPIYILQFCANDDILTCPTVWPLTMYSFPTFTLGFSKPLMRSAELMPIK